MRILFFSHLKDATGQSEVEWPDTGPLTGADLWRRLEQSWPAVAAHRRATRLARNGEYVANDTLFQPGDEIAMIPPVSGG